MEAPAPNENTESEYMAMDPDQWEDQDDTYDNGDTLGNDKRQIQGLPLPGRATLPAIPDTLQTNIQNIPQPPKLPQPTRYQTLRWPSQNGNRGKGKQDQSELFKKISLGLALLCVLSIGVLIGLCIVVNAQAGIYLKVNEEKSMLQEEIQKLQETMDTNNWCKTNYHISNDLALNSAKELHVLNDEVLQKYMYSERHFFIFYNSLKNDTCFTSDCRC